MSTPPAPAALLQYALAQSDVTDAPSLDPGLCLRITSVVALCPHLSTTQQPLSQHPDSTTKLRNQDGRPTESQPITYGASMADLRSHYGATTEDLRRIYGGTTLEKQYGNEAKVPAIAVVREILIRRPISGR